jgi:hypothetical protein
MKKSAILASVIIALTAGSAIAQSSNFDARKFFDRLQLEGASMPASFDAQKFFDKLRAEGASVPAQLDGKVFLNKIRSEGMPQPDMVVPVK